MRERKFLVGTCDSCATEYGTDQRYEVSCAGIPGEGDCTLCQSQYCEECRVMCELCALRMCPSCIRPCIECKEKTCTECLNEAGYCTACVEDGRKGIAARTAEYETNRNGFFWTIAAVTVAVFVAMAVTTWK